MQKNTCPRAARLAMITCWEALALSVLFCVAGCSRVVHDDNWYRLRSLTEDEENFLYSDLRSKHPDYQNLALPYRGIVESVLENRPVRVVWMTESSPIGEGIIGIYDCQHKLLDIRITRPIKQISCTAINKGPHILVLKELSVTGSGVREETMYILDVDNLNTPLWSGKVESWFSGSGKIQGYSRHCVVLLLDLNSDGREEVLVIGFNEVGTDQQFMAGKRDIECKALLFDPDAHKFVGQKKMSPRILYPTGVKVKDNF